RATAPSSGLDVIADADRRSGDGSTQIGDDSPADLRRLIEANLEVIRAFGALDLDVLDEGERVAIGVGDEAPAIAGDEPLDPELALVVRADVTHFATPEAAVAPELDACVRDGSTIRGADDLADERIARVELE